MKISVENENVILTPENQLDCYNLGKIQFPKCSLVFTRNDNIPKPGTIDYLEVEIPVFLEFLFK